MIEYYIYKNFKYNKKYSYKIVLKTPELVIVFAIFLLLLIL